MKMSDIWYTTSSDYPTTDKKEKLPYNEEYIDSKNGIETSINIRELHFLPNFATLSTFFKKTDFSQEIRHHHFLLLPGESKEIVRLWQHITPWFDN